MGVIIANQNGYNRQDLDLKSYEIPIRMSDNPSSNEDSQAATYVLKLVIEDKNYHMHQAGHKEVQVYNYKREMEQVPLGNVYVEDIDDWDLADKEFKFKDPVPVDVLTWFRYWLRSLRLVGVSSTNIITNTLDLYPAPPPPPPLPPTQVLPTHKI